MTSIQIELRRIMEQITTISDEPYVKATIGKPSIPIFFVYLLFSMMKANQIPLKRIESYCIAVSLLQMGLSSHEQVTTESLLSSQQMRSRQLVVLSGDYYTSLFYQGLAEVQEMEGIHLLAKVVGSIHETKMLHYAHEQSHTHFGVTELKRIQVMESGLLTALVDFFYVGKPSSAIWKRICANLLLIDRLSQHPEWMARFDAESFIWIEDRWVELRQMVSELQMTEVKEQLLQWLEQQQGRIDALVFSTHR
jgi:heptaprenyl diphosphate synthase